MAKKLKRTVLRKNVERIDMLLSIRNLLGAHYNEWADSIPWSDIRDFGQEVLDLYETVYCRKCADWVGSVGKGFSCRCGAMVVAGAVEVAS